MATSNKTKKRKPSVTKKKQIREEITGLCIGAIGIYLFLCIYTQYSGMLGTIIHDVLFGTFGLLAYLLPFMIVVIAALVIVKRKRKAKITSIISWTLFLISVMSIIHIIFKDNFNSNSFESFVTTSYIYGKSAGLGLGAFIAIITYPLIYYIDVPGAYIVFSTYIIAMILIKLGISLRSVTRDVGDKISETTTDLNTKVKTKTQEILEKRRLYIDDLSVDADNIVNEELQILADDDFGNEENDDMPDFLKKSKKTEVPIFNTHEDKEEKVEIKKEDKTEEEWNKAKAAIGKDVEIPPYVFPPLDLLKKSSNKRDMNAEAECRKNAIRLEETLESFGIRAKVIQVSRGPAVTRFELQPPPGIKISRITNLSKDIALSLAAQGVRIEAPIPGKAAIGIEIPNDEVAIVKLRDIVESTIFTRAKSHLSMCLGKDITGKNVVADLSKMPHMLIAGATGSGKSVCINSIIISLLYKSAPEDVRMILIDPKRVELSIYNGIPHLLIPVVNDAKKAAGALNWAINEMTKRYELFSSHMAKDINRYNEMAEENDSMEKIPQIVIIIDELADLMAVARNEVEDSVVRLAQLARAAGIHLIIATQRPSVDVITGIIKANIPARIAFAVYSQIDARTILDTSGAEKLLGRGDMLFTPSGAPKPIRLQGAFVDEKEVYDVTNFIRTKKLNYSDEIINDVEKMQSMGGKSKGFSGESDIDNMVSEGIDAIFDMQQASISLLQRKLRVGYARAARIVDDIEKLGVIGPKDGSKPRDILVTRQQAHQKAEEYNG